MIRSTETAETVVIAAVVIICGLGSALTTAVVGAALEALSPGAMDRSLTRVKLWPAKALRWTLRLRAARMVYAVLVTYVHTYRADKVTGRHYSGHGRMFGKPARHRAVPA